MDFLQIVLTAVCSLAFMFLLTKWMGHKQVAQMTAFDYVEGITLGSIAAELATDLETPWRPALAMLIYGIAGVLISLWTNKSLKAREKISGTPEILMEHGVIHRDRLRRAKMDLSDFLSACRTAGYFDPADIELAVLEYNGNLSILPTEGKRPLTPSDMRIQPAQSFLPTPVIMDGEILRDNLHRLGTDETWLKKQLSERRVHSEKEVFLALCDHDMVLSVYPIRD